MLKTSWRRFSVVVTAGLEQRSYFLPDPVSAWVGDRKPPRRRTRHTGLLSLSNHLSLSVDRLR